MKTGEPFDPTRHLTKLKGSDYLEVKYRIQWFRDVHPQGVIMTTIHTLTEKSAVITADISTPDGARATGVGSETSSDFKDFIEKAETKAIGRALAALGFGTQFAPELDEDDRIVDAPVNRQQAKPDRNAPVELASVAQKNLIIGLAKQLGMVKPDGHHDGPRLDESLRKRVNAPLSELSKKQASDVIEMMQKAVEAAKMDAAIANATPGSLPLDVQDAPDPGRYTR